MIMELKVSQSDFGNLLFGVPNLNFEMSTKNCQRFFLYKGKKAGFKIWSVYLNQQNCPLKFGIYDSDVTFDYPFYISISTIVEDGKKTKSLKATLDRITVEEGKLEEIGFSFKQIVIYVKELRDFVNCSRPVAVR